MSHRSLLDYGRVHNAVNRDPNADWEVSQIPYCDRDYKRGCSQGTAGVRNLIWEPDFKGNMAKLQALQISMTFFFCRWLLTLGEYCESFRTENNLV